MSQSQPGGAVGAAACGEDGWDLVVGGGCATTVAGVDGAGGDSLTVEPNDERQLDIISWAPQITPVSAAVLPDGRVGAGAVK